MRKQILRGEIGYISVGHELDRNEGRDSRSDRRERGDRKERGRNREDREEREDSGETPDGYTRLFIARGAKDGLDKQTLMDYLVEQVGAKNDDFKDVMDRSKPAVPFAGKYRLVDIPISNCINSDIKQIYILTQFNSASLHNHIANTYIFDTFSNGFVEILAAEQTYHSESWYQGTADAVRKNMRVRKQQQGTKDQIHNLQKIHLAHCSSSLTTLPTNPTSVSLS